MKAKADTMTPEELKGKIIIGEFVNVEDAREYTERYNEVIKRAQKA
jgi:2-oxoglutarate ferredoxin oxidoreductase subunit beta